MTHQIPQGDERDLTACDLEGSMDTPMHTQAGPLYRYKGVVMVQREIEILAESDEAFEEQVAQLIESEGLRPQVYEIIRVAADRTDALWQ